MDRALVRRYSRTIQRHRGSAVSSAELSAFEALTPTQIGLLLQGVPPARGGVLGWLFSIVLGLIATGAQNFRIGCAALVPSGASYLGIHRTWAARTRVAPPR